jgi:hypothetical protein
VPARALISLKVAAFERRSIEVLPPANPLQEGQVMGQPLARSASTRTAAAKASGAKPAAKSTPRAAVSATAESAPRPRRRGPAARPVEAGDVLPTMTAEAAENRQVARAVERASAVQSLTMAGLVEQRDLGPTFFTPEAHFAAGRRVIEEDQP